MRRFYSPPALIAVGLYISFFIALEWYLLSCNHGGWMDLCGIERYLVVPELIVLPASVNPVNLDSLFSAETYNYSDYYIYGPNVLLTYLGTVVVNALIIYLAAYYLHRRVIKRKQNARSY